MTLHARKPLEGTGTFPQEPLTYPLLLLLTELALSLPYQPT